MQRRLSLATRSMRTITDWGEGQVPGEAKGGLLLIVMNVAGGAHTITSIPQ